MKKENYIYLGVFLVVLLCGILLIKLNSKGTLSSVKTIPASADTEEETNMNFTEDGIFKTYYKLANNYVGNMTLDEKIGQLLLVKYDSLDTKVFNYNPSGFILNEDNFSDKTKDNAIKMTKDIKAKAKTPFLITVNEEGGDNVSISSNTNLVSERYKFPSEIYASGGLDAISADTIAKSKLLASLGINVNLAPVVDISLDNTSYIYPRTLQEDVLKTSNYAKSVIKASKGTGVSYVLKHFPGYGDNTDTTTTKPVDNREYDDIRDDYLPPFESGIDAGAEAVLVGHVKVTNIDDSNPSSLSKPTIKLLRDTLDFTGVVISDDLDKEAVNDIENLYSKAISAGNDLIIVSDYSNAIKDIKKALIDETLTEEDINNHVKRVIAWKYYKGIMNTTLK